MEVDSAAHVIDSRVTHQIAIEPRPESRGTVGSHCDDMRTLEFRETACKPSQRGIRRSRFLASVVGH